jgi:hypothetical protein
MKRITHSLLALALTLTVLLSCNKSDLTPASTNSTSTASLNASGSGGSGHSACGMHCTCTQAQWGTEKKASETIAKYFVMEFPNGFPLGSRSCGNGHIAWVKDANAMKQMLPMKGAPAVLTQDYKNSLPNNSLLGELIALCCNMDLEHYDPMFDSNTTPLRDMKIATGTFQGKTVFEFFKVANEVLGGCNNMYTPAQVDEVAKNINANYLMHGKDMIDNGYLMCP